MDEAPGNHARQDCGYDDKAILPLARWKQMREVHAVDAGYEIGNHDDDSHRCEPLHDEAEPIEGMEDVHVESGSKQIAMGVQLCQHVRGMILHVAEVRSELDGDRTFAAENLGQHVARGCEKAWNSK